MDLHFSKQIFSDSKEFQEFKNILKYTFFFDLDEAMTLCRFLPDESNNPDIIDEIFSKCDSMCKPIFFKDSPRFFGFNNDTGKEHEQLLRSLTNNTFWKTAIKYHCVISSLYTLLHYQTSDYMLSFYRIINDIRHYGYFSLIDKNILSVEPDTSIKRNKQKKPDKDSITYSENCANYSKSYKSFYSNLHSNEQAALGITLGKRRVKTCLLNSDLIYQLFRLHSEGNIFKKFHRFYQKNDMNFSCNDYFCVAQKLQEIINTRDEGEDIVDHILLQYKAERFYNCSLTYCIIKSLLDFSHKQDLLTMDSFPLEILELTFHLPNIFSRNIFFIYALYSFSNTYLTDGIFGKARENFSPFVKFGEKRLPDRMRLITWLPLFQYFIRFFSTIVFPLYEKSFFLLLIQGLSSDKNHLPHIIQLLHDYIEKHAQDIYITVPEIADTPDQMLNFSNLKITPIDYTNKMEKQTLDLFTKKILIKQNNIFHASPYSNFNNASFGFTSDKTETYSVSASKDDVL